MSPNNDAADLLREDNYFVWEFNARMKLAKKGLLAHIDAAKVPIDDIEWKVNDMKAFATITTMISINLQSMVRNAQTTAQAWELLKTFFLRRSIHNRVQMRRKLHEFKMSKGGNVMDHFMKFDELCMTMNAIGEEVSYDEQLVILLGSLPDEYDQIIKIIENIPNIDIFQAKEMLQREYEGISRKETNEIALKATREREYKSKGPRHEGRWNNRLRPNGKPACQYCKRTNHAAQDCWYNPSKRRSSKEQAFTVSEHYTDGWVLDSGASSHMCPIQDEFSDIRPLDMPIPISVANGGRIMAVGVGTIRVTLKNSKPIRIENVLYVPKLDRKLPSISALSKKGLDVSFNKNCCTIKNGEDIIIKVPRRGKLFILECVPTESANLSEDTGPITKPVSSSVWHARLGHLPMKTMNSITDQVIGVKMKNLPQESDDQDEICEGCVTGRSTVKPFLKSDQEKIKTKQPLQVVHSDVVGPMETTSQGVSSHSSTTTQDMWWLTISQTSPKLSTDSSTTSPSWKIS